MKKWAKSLGWFSAGVVFTVAVAVLAGSAMAAGGFGPRAGGAALGATAEGWAPRGGGMWGGWFVADVVAKDLGLTQEQLRAGLQEHGSIARLAEAKGVSLDQIKADILAAAQTHHDELAAVGRVTAEQAAELQAKFAENIDQMLAADGPMGGYRGFGGPKGAGPAGGGVLIDTVATSLNITVDDLKTALAEHRSIAKVVAARGASLDQVKADILAAVAAQHEELVAAGKLTAEQAAAGLERFTETLDQKLTSERPLGPGPGLGPRGGRGMGPGGRMGPRGGMGGPHFGDCPAAPEAPTE